MRDLHRIRTPENVVFEFALAGIAARALAWGLDLAVMGALTILTMLAVGLFGVVFAGLATAVYFVIAFAIQWGYGVLLESGHRGQTIGKRIVGLRVISLDGMPVTFTQAAVRNLARIVDLLPALYLVGGTCALLDPHGRRLGDLAAGTVVVRRRRSPRPSAVMAAEGRYNSFLSDASVSQAVAGITPPERDAMLGLSMRRDSLPLPVRHALFAKLAAHFELRLRVKRPDYLSEERYVLNLTTVALGMWKDSPHGAQHSRQP